MKIVIIEDEIPAAKRIEKLIKEADKNAEIIAKLDSIEASVNWFSKNPQPDLILMDIELADGQSFEIFNRIKITSPVIFTTAYDEFALKAFKVNSIDYLLKPIEIQSLKQSLDKWNALKGNSQSNNMSSLIESFSAKKYKNRFLVKIGERLIAIENEQIAYFMTEDKYSFIISTENKKYILDQSLDEIENMLAPRLFFRLNRQFIAPFKSIEAIHNHLNGKLKIILKPTQKEEIYVSREKASDFKFWLDS